MLILALGLNIGIAQTPLPTPAPSTTPPPATSRRAGQVLSPSELATLRALFVKLRPGTLRLETCPTADCRIPRNVGTAFHIGNGYALTSYIMVHRAQSLSAQTLDQKRYAAEVIGYDEQSDMALLRVNLPAETPVLPLAATAPVSGDALLGIGNSGNTFLTPKMGRLTGLNADAGRADFPAKTLQTDVPFRHGDTGGPIINAKGEVVGVMSFIHVGSDATYAVPVTTSDPRIADLRQGVKRNAPMIGLVLSKAFSRVSALPASSYMAFIKHFKLDLGPTPGAFFTSVFPNAAGAQAGLQPLKSSADNQWIAGDIVTAVNSERVNNFSELQSAVRRYQPGESVTLTVLRAGQEIQVKVTLMPSTSLPEASGENVV
nr:S1C family serine protease [Deinococcus arboris]